MTSNQTQVQLRVPGFITCLLSLKTYKKILYPSTNAEDVEFREDVGFKLGFLACSVIMPLHCKEIDLGTLLFTMLASACVGYIGSGCFRYPVVPIMLTPMFVSAFFIRNRI